MKNLQEINRRTLSIWTVNPITCYTHSRGVCSCLANVVVNAKTFFVCALFFDSSVFVSCEIYDVLIISQNISFVISAKFWQMCKPLRNWCQMRQNFSRSSVLCLLQSTMELISRVIRYCSKKLLQFFFGEEGGWVTFVCNKFNSDDLSEI